MNRIHPMRFYRTSDEAFRTPRYATAIERHTPKRPVAAWWIAFIVVAALLVAWRVA